MTPADFISGTTPSVTYSLPVLRLEKRGPEIVIEAIAVLGLVMTVVLLIVSWSSTPEIIPHHFDFAGKPDSWGCRWVLVIMPIFSIALYVFLSAVSRFPHRFNYPWPITSANAERQYRIALSLMLVLKTEIVYLFGFITLNMMRSQGLGPGFLPIVVATLLGTILVHLVVAHRAR